MTLSLICPECSGKLKVADNLAGKKIKCPKCSTVFSAAVPQDAIVAEIVAEQPPDFDDEELSRPRRPPRDIRRDAGDDDVVSTMIPYKNGRALIAYYLGVFSLIPCLGLLLGPAALILGILGIRYANAHPTAKGGGHAITGIILGSLTTLGNWGLVIVGAIAAVLG